jgi:hypothetical protein
VSLEIIEQLEQRLVDEFFIADPELRLLDGRDPLAYLGSEDFWRCAGP